MPSKCYCFGKFLLKNATKISFFPLSCQIKIKCLNVVTVLTRLTFVKQEKSRIFPFLSLLATITINVPRRQIPALPILLLD